MFRVSLTVIGSILGLLTLSFVLNSLGMMSWKFFGTWSEQIRYDIHKESQTYRDGMQRNLSQMATDWASSDQAGKLMIEASVKHQYSQTDTSEYPPYLQDFLRSVGVQ